jgi:hypothetical protein
MDDGLEVDGAVMFFDDLAKLCDQNRVERLFNHYLHPFFKGIPAQNAVSSIIIRSI